MSSSGPRFVHKLQEEMNSFGKTNKGRVKKFMKQYQKNLKTVLKNDLKSKIKLQDVVDKTLNQLNGFIDQINLFYLERAIK